MKITGKTAIQIFEQIRGLIGDGELVPGTLLPSVRELAYELGVNRNTVALAYKRLTDAGFTVSNGRNGTSVREMLAPLELEGSTQGIVLQDLASGNPSIEAFLPLISMSTLSDGKPSLYGEPVIDPELERIGRGLLLADVSDVFELNLTSGAVDAVERMLSSFLIPGDSVAVEDPCFLSSISTLRFNRFHASPVSVDEEGMQADELDARLSDGAKAVIITPRAHNPTGCSLSAFRAAQLRSVLNKYPNVLVIIDDHFSLLSCDEYHHVIPENTRNWALIRSTSKFLGPDLRLAFVASDIDTSRRLRQRLNGGTSWVSHLLQNVATASFNSPQFDALISEARNRYHQQRESLVIALKKSGVAVSAHHDGLNVWIPLKVDSSTIVMKMAQHGWLVRGGEAFGLDGVSCGIRITISDLDDEETEIIAKTLATILADQRQNYPETGLIKAQ